MREMNSNRRTELAGFLRARRARLSPRQGGLPEAGTPHRRRTPGLRRQEVAQLAGLSVDYYIRLEQARGPHPSRQVLAALARALMLTADERDYLFRMAGQAPPPAPRPSREISPGIRHLLESMPGIPAIPGSASSPTVPPPARPPRLPSPSWPTAPRCPARGGPQVRHAHETPLPLKGCIREMACGAHMTPPRC
jgi:transcriptional regulator with XRE-family HTH domain